MSEKHARVADMVAKILALLPALDTSRRKMFFLWLRSHHSGTCFTDGNLRDRLTDWFDTLSVDSLDGEYRLILSEIVWWRELDEQSFAEVVRSERALAVQHNRRDDMGNEHVSASSGVE